MVSAHAPLSTVAAVDLFDHIAKTYNTLYFHGSLLTRCYRRLCTLIVYSH